MQEQRKRLVGKVVSTKMDKTVVVVVRRTRQPAASAIRESHSGQQTVQGSR